MLSLIAAGGSGTRMAPVTSFLNKHLIPVGQNELMIDMPLKFLASHSIREVQIVTGSNHASQICEYVGDGERYGFTMVEYSFQPRPLGIADVLKRVSHKNIEDGVLLILGDNFFSRQQAELHMLKTKGTSYASAWEYDLGNKEKAKSFGQIFRNENGVPVSIVEKPSEPQSGRILTGLYYFPHSVFDLVERLEPSKRGELEVTDLLRIYLDMKKLAIHPVEGEWCDLGEQDTWARFVSSRK